ncbi:unnamed protein product [Linum trigynum]|uniref:Uncharacterized protein n=1 Tax=Linum trigynum TaxID=586398 RepID=A0AAV2ENN1_9ROSI
MKASNDGSAQDLHQPEVFPSDEKHGKFGEMMVGMLPEDLPFTVFMPSARAFERDIRLQAADGDTNSTRNDSYAVVCRILGFSAVPRALHSTILAPGEEV